MIPYPELEKAIARWKLRQGEGAAAGPPPAEAEAYGGLPADESPAETSSGLIPLGDDAAIVESSDDPESY